MFSYRTTLKLLFEEFDDGNPEVQLANVTTRIVLALQNNLDGKARQYKDPALTQLFLMNNIHYIVRSVRRFVQSSYLIEKVPSLLCARKHRFEYIFSFRSEAKDVLGDDWVQIQRRIVQQHANQYKRVSWAKVYFFNYT